MAQTGSRFSQRKSGARRDSAEVGGRPSPDSANGNRPPKPSKHIPAPAGGAPKTSSPSTPLFRHLLIGRGLGWFGGIVLIVILLQIAVQFRWHNKQPVPGICAEYYPAYSGHQNTDVYDWVRTGLMLPDNAIFHRAPRPLFPLIVTAAASVGMVTVPPNFRPMEMPQAVVDQSIRVIQVANVMMVTISLWLFFCGCVWLGVTRNGALLATILAGSGFGFSFWVTQAIPEVLSYFSVAVTIAGAALLAEYHGQRRRALVQSALVCGALGVVTGVLLLGKELYFLVLFVALLMVWKRMWIGVVAFGVMCALPTMFWMHYITNVARFFDPARYYQEYKFMVWIWQELLPADTVNKIRLMGANLQSQITALLQAFVYVPVLLGIVGISAQRFPRQGIVLGAFFLSLYGAMLASNFAMPRIMYVAWPFVFFFAWVGIDFIAQRASDWLPGTMREKARWGMAGVVVLVLAWLQNQMLFGAYCYG